MKNRISYRQKKRFTDIQMVLTFSVSISLLGAVPLSPEEGETITGQFGKLAFSIDKAKEHFFTSIQARLRQNEPLPLDVVLDQKMADRE
jgi:hypothetical protein